jgi:hypothetical protein
MHGGNINFLTFTCSLHVGKRICIQHRLVTLKVLHYWTYPSCIGAGFPGSKSGSLLLWWLWDIVSPPVEFILPIQTMDFLAHSGVLGKAGSRTEWDGEYSGCGMARVWLFIKNCWSARQEWQNTLSFLFHSFFEHASVHYEW